ncbi:hypothetical protein K9M74_01205 [Candidatus Woesearchaeota archaeon]|nr:hypothetical protein [Candidatus Woesearchaeota archaeon]
MSEALNKIIKEMNDPEVLAEHQKINARIDPRFESPELLKHIHAELDKRHKLDHKEKLAVFIVAASGYLRDARDHCSCALKGNSSSGKDNVMDTVLAHFPKDDVMKGTRLTSPSLEDDVKDKKVIAFSEINKHREGGANSSIVETFKQLAEGGTCTLKKDAKTGFKTAIRNEQKQKTLLYATTETESDEEMETRYVIAPIRGYREKNKIVVDDVLDKASDEEYYLEKNKQEDSWIATSISLLDQEVQVIIPYSKVLSQKVDGKEIFDTRKDRVKRDVKRIMSLTRANAWLHQLQRKSKYVSDMKFIYAEPADFINALKIFADLVNLTYSGIDHRLQRLLEYVEENVGKHKEEIKIMGFQEKYFDWVLRHKAQKALKIGSVKTIRDWCGKLADKNKIEIYKDQYVNKRTVMLRPIHLTSNNLALPVNITNITMLLQAWLESDHAKQIYQDHKIIPFIIDFEDYGEDIDDEPDNSSTYYDENDMSESTCEELIVTEEYVSDEKDTEHQKMLDLED